MALPITMVPTKNGMRRANVDVNGNVISTEVPGGISQAVDGSLTQSSQGLLPGQGGYSYPGFGYLGSYKKGGKIHKTGMAKLHKGEVVLNKKQQAKVGKQNIKKALKNIYG